MSVFGIRITINNCTFANLSTHFLISLHTLITVYIFFVCLFVGALLECSISFILSRNDISERNGISVWYEPFSKYLYILIRYSNISTNDQKLYWHINLKCGKIFTSWSIGILNLAWYRLFYMKMNESLSRKL